LRVTDGIRTGVKPWRGLVLTADTTVTWSLRSDSNGRPSPYRGDALTSRATKARAGQAGIEPASSYGSTPQRPYRQSNWPPEPPIGFEPMSDAYKASALPAELQGRSVLGAIRTCTTHLLKVVPPTVGLRGRGAATRCRPGSPALRGRGRSRARRQSWPSWLRTRKLRVQGPAGLPIPPMAIGCGRRESNAQAARSELARYTSSLHSRVVRHLGLEPRPDTG
jgi:hypothetical protein